jgi:hypothetical protein
MNFRKPLLPISAAAVIIRRTEKTGGIIMESFSQIVNSLLYIISGFFFGIFASRHSIFSVINIRRTLAEKDYSPASLFRLAFSFLFMVLAFLVFPSWMASRTTIGAIAYYAVLLFYFSKGWKSLQK